MIMSINTVDLYRKYPKIMQNTQGLVVLFYLPSCGIILKSSHPDNHVGQNCIDFDMEYFEDYNEPITIKNV